MAVRNVDVVAVWHMEVRHVNMVAVRHMDVVTMSDMHMCSAAAAAPLCLGLDLLVLMLCKCCVRHLRRRRLERTLHINNGDNRPGAAHQHCYILVETFDD